MREGGWVAGWGRERSSIRTTQVLFCAEREQQRHKHSRDVWSCWAVVGETSDTSSVAVGSWGPRGEGWEVMAGTRQRRRPDTSTEVACVGRRMRRETEVEREQGTSGFVCVR